jgi:hypothetical protein
MASIMTMVPGAVVGCARARVPGIEVGAEHHDFVFFVGARNFGDGVVLHGIVVVESVGDVQFERVTSFFCASRRAMRLQCSRPL